MHCQCVLILDITMSGRESELRDVAGDGDRKRSCFTRRPLLCCSVLGVVLVIALVLCAVIPVLYVEVVEPEVDEVIDKVSHTGMLPTAHTLAVLLMGMGGGF